MIDDDSAKTASTISTSKPIPILCLPQHVPAGAYTEIGAVVGYVGKVIRKLGC